MQKNNKVIGIEQVTDLYDYETVKENLIVRLNNYDKNKLRMKKVVHQVVGDMAIVLYAIVRFENNDYTAIKVEKKLFQKWKVEENQCMADALLNTNLLYLPRIYDKTPDHDSANSEQGIFMTPMYDLKMRKGYTINLLTNEKKRNGAAAIFYPGVKERIAQLMKDDFYIVFTSIHEAMLHSCSTVDPQRLKRSLLEVNLYSEGAEVLSDSIYCYRREQKEMFQVL